MQESSWDLRLLNAQPGQLPVRADTAAKTAACWDLPEPGLLFTCFPSTGLSVPPASGSLAVFGALFLTWGGPQKRLPKSPNLAGAPLASPRRAPWERPSPPTRSFVSALAEKL